MSDIVLHRESNSISISVLLENYKKYNLNPPGQRKSVWSEEKESFLIDSIMRNFPMPPIFLRQIIDKKTGSTKYDVIDGKQRLTAIKKFADNKLQVATDEDPNDDQYADEIAGKFFKELKNDYQEKFRFQFWRYSIPVEYIESNDGRVIDSIFDRLNRNGEALTRQELRNSKYHDNIFHQAVIQLSDIGFWNTRLMETDKRRMENHEFVAELFATLQTGKCVNSNPKDIETLYDIHTKLPHTTIDSTVAKFKEITAYLESLKIDYEKYKVSGVSHLYAHWVFAIAAKELHIPSKDAAALVEKFYKGYRSAEAQKNQQLIDYKKSMTTNTKSRSMRMMRIKSMLDYCSLSYEVK